MKLFFTPLLAVLLTSMPAMETRAQSFSVDWFATAGGGGTSTGSVFSVSGTIGQPAATGGPMTGGSYSFTGGFWALYVVPVTGAPWLAIAQTNNAVMVYWSSASTNWVLEQNASLSSTHWMNVPQYVMKNGTSQYIIVNPSGSNQFYRLSSQGQ
ncbi:MAG: hypothetical protein P4N60_18090 [Verrucomicrobiae bacterium]|nr:hypothetical protein [Verrucomicrobiae bacterium]